MPCMCGDLYCPSCGPLQGNFKCHACGKWTADGGCVDPEFCASVIDQDMAAELDAQDECPVCLALRSEGGCDDPDACEDEVQGRAEERRAISESMTP